MFHDDWMVYLFWCSMMIERCICSDVPWLNGVFVLMFHDWMVHLFWCSMMIEWCIYSDVPWWLNGLFVLMFHDDWMVFFFYRSHWCSMMTEWCVFYRFRWCSVMTVWCISFHAPLMFHDDCMMYLFLGDNIYHQNSYLPMSKEINCVTDVPCWLFGVSVSRCHWCSMMTVLCICF